METFLLKNERQRHRTGTGGSHTLNPFNIVPARLFERVRCTKSQSSFLNICFRLSGFQSSLLLLLSKQEWQKRIRCVKFHFQDCRGVAWLRYRNRTEITVLMCEQKPYPAWFSCRRKTYPLWKTAQGSVYMEVGYPR